MEKTISLEEIIIAQPDIMQEIDDKNLDEGIILFSDLDAWHYGANY